MRRKQLTLRATFSEDVNDDACVLRGPPTDVDVARADPCELEDCILELGGGARAICVVDQITDMTQYVSAILSEVCEHTLPGKLLRKNVISCDTGCVIAKRCSIRLRS